MKFEAFFKENQNLLYRIVYSYVRKKDISEDIVLETFMKVHDRWDKVQGFENPVGYLVRIGINMAKKHLLNNRFSWSPLHDDMQTGDIDPETYALLADESEKLEAALLELKENERNIIISKDMEDMKFQDIADMMELKLPTVKSLYRRAKLKLVSMKEAGYA